MTAGPNQDERRRIGAGDCHRIANRGRLRLAAVHVHDQPRFKSRLAVLNAPLHY
jgi:hypothetical protein